MCSKTHVVGAPQSSLNCSQKNRAAAGSSKLRRRLLAQLDLVCGCETFCCQSTKHVDLFRLALRNSVLEACNAKQAAHANNWRPVLVVPCQLSQVYPSSSAHAQHCKLPKSLSSLSSTPRLITSSYESVCCCSQSGQTQSSRTQAANCSL